MPTTSSAPGRRERNKQDKLERITAAAREFFSQHGIDDVTTQQIADAADIGTGTLFLYAKSKSELLLLVQNSAYADALERGTAEASSLDDPLDAIMAILTPVIECNRTQVDNGRTYLREIVFGDHDEPHHRDAVGYSLATAEAVATVLSRSASVTPEDAAMRAQVVSAVMFTTLAATPNATSSVGSLVAQIRAQVEVILPPVAKR